MIAKCSECGNTFDISVPSKDKIVACPVCEASYEASVEKGRVHLKTFINEDYDAGEL